MTSIFKAGDRVRFESASSFAQGTGQAPEDMLEEYVVAHSGGHHTLVSLEGLVANVFEFRLKHLTAPAEPAFKAGDRVRVIEDGEYSARAGVCEILSIHGCKDDVTVGRYEDLPDGEHDESYTQVAHVSDLRRVGVKTKFKDLIHVPAVATATPPSTHAIRKGRPVTRGVLDYFPDAILALAEVSRLGNEQHHPGAPLHWEKDKSADHADCAVRHLMDRGTKDDDGCDHSGKAAWRALANYQTELEAADPELAARRQAQRDAAAKGQR